MAFFGADTLTLEEITTPDIILWAVGPMLFFTAVEYIVARKEQRNYYENKELIGSVGVGIGNLIISALIKGLLMAFIIWAYNFVPWRMQFSWWALLPCYVLYDLCSYWAHRISHEQRFWWATHVTHHSGEHYNLAVSFRLSWVQHLKIIFFIPVIAMGFHPVIFFITNQLAVLFQFWVHTEYIRRLHPVIEYILATPSNHRVHHGTQEKYIDKNYAATFIFWDRMFGTYQPEEEQVIYGLTTPVGNKANPFWLIFHEYIDIYKDVRAAKGFRKKLYFLFGSPMKIAIEKKQAVSRDFKSGDAVPENQNEEIAV